MYTDTRNETETSGGGGAAAARLARIQAVSGLAFGLFAVVHLTNAMFAVGGPDAYNGMQRALRTVYQLPWVEAGMFGALAVHVAAGVARARRRSGASGGNSRKPPWPQRVHRLTGVFLAIVVPLHALATRGPSLAFDVWPEFGGVAFSIWWSPWVYGPYYFVLSGAALYHLGFGAHRALRVLRWRVPRVPRAIGLGAWGVAAVVILLALLSFGGALRPIPDPTANDYARLWEQLGVTELPDRKAAAEDDPDSPRGSPGPAKGGSQGP